MVRWWCSGQVAVPWTWTPQPYIGIWLTMIVLAVGYVVAVRAHARSTGDTYPTRGQLAAFVVGWLLLWATTDWPLGALAAGYLLTASMVQIVLYYYIIAPLFVHAIPRDLRIRCLTGRYAGPLRLVVQRPLIAFVLLTATLIITHIPVATDTLKALQVGTMLMDTSWLLTAFLYWWALDAYRPAGQDARFGTRLLYVMGSKVVPTLLGIILTFHNFPIYTTYEFANRAFIGFTALDDQQAAGLLMWMGMVPLLMVRLGLVFYEAALAATPSESPAVGPNDHNVPGGR